MSEQISNGPIDFFEQMGWTTKEGLLKGLDVYRQITAAGPYMPYEDNEPNRTDLVRVAETGHNTLCRVYYPDGDGPFPMVFMLHGGGFCSGTMDIGTETSKAICHDSSCAVIEVDYVLVPEHPFPEAIEECYNVIKYFHENASRHNLIPSKIAVGGGSAGATYAAAICHLAAERKDFPVSLAILYYPKLDQASAPDTYLTPFTDTSSLNVDFSNAMTDLCLEKGEIRKSPLASPYYGDVSGFPKTLLLVGNRDILWKEAEKMFLKLTDAGIEVLMKVYNGCGHGFDVSEGQGTDKHPHVKKNHRDLVAAELKAAFMDETGE